MKKGLIWLHMALLMCLFYSCAPDVEMTGSFNWTEFQYEDEINIYGFGGGFLHGLMIPFELTGALINWLFDLTQV